MSEKVKLAEDLFRQGYNCSQAVVCAFADETGLDFETLCRMSSSFGGGMGRLREVCGAVSGMLLIWGLKYGYTDPSDTTAKKEQYVQVQRLAALFKEENESIVCRELLSLGNKLDSPIPAERTAAYYQKRPCVQLVASAARILEQALI